MIFGEYIDKITAVLKHKDTLRRELAFAVRWHQPWLAARIIATMPQPFDVGVKASLQTPIRRVLLLNSGKTEFIRDLHEILRHNDDFEPVIWPHYVLDTMARAILGPDLTHDAYISGDPATEAKKPRFRRFLASMWRQHQKLQPIHAVISPNFGYLSQREFAAALEMTGTPFLVVQKENLNAASEERRAIWKKIYTTGRGKFGGRKIIVYNQMERDLEVDAGVVSPERVEVVGMPRLDGLHRWRRENAGRQQDGVAQVLFFAFSRVDKIPQDMGIGKDWGQFCTDTHRAILDFARTNPEVVLVAKTKGLTRQDDELQELVATELGEAPLNVRVVSGGDSFSLMAESRVVVGFNTSGLIEALALGKPVIVPRFGEALDPQLSKFVIDLSDAVDYADSPAQLRDLVAEYVRGPQVTPADLPPNVKGHPEALGRK
jgi:hypothetical protein